MRIKTLRLSPLLRVIALGFALSLIACSTKSPLLLPGPTVNGKPATPLDPPRVSCKKEATPPTPKQPCKDCWIDVQHGWLSQQASTWVVTVLGLLDKERALRAEEHRCLDEHAEKGVIRQ